MSTSWASNLLSIYYPLLLSCCSLIVCFWAEVSNWYVCRREVVTTSLHPYVKGWLPPPLRICFRPQSANMFENLFINFLFIMKPKLYMILHCKTAIQQAEIYTASCLKCGAFCSAIQGNLHPVQPTEMLKIPPPNGSRLFEMIIYWFFLKNVTFYFTKKLETRCK